MRYLKIMFWLFKRKKVADKKAITPCVCDSGDPVPDALNLQEFGTRSTSDATISSRLNASESGSRSSRKGYHRLEGKGPEDITVLQPQPPSLPLPPTSYSRMSAHNPEECVPPSSGSSDSSSDNERDYFEGFTDSDDEDEELTCNFCERSFNSVRRLEQHQQRKRHYMCSICDTVFDGLMLLEMHKETLDHWSDYELKVKQAQEESDYSEEELEEHRIYSNRSGDELRRLLL
ncbi:uncharacterized protein LOC129963792 [Argiope bruennichi]|uniref:uncharacterized protein LOC129963792 n=1 Tax=Argiope bruennichi TaxID=94029 RepID=UPI0024950F36|nr:uncharacterized protein LOC129963792 [Argiope bruennichi]